MLIHTVDAFELRGLDTGELERDVVYESFSQYDAAILEAKCKLEHL